MSRLRHRARVRWFLAAWAGLVLLAGCAPARHHSQPPESSAPVEPSSYTYREVGGRSLKAYVFSPSVPSRSPAVLLFHGGGWSAGSADWTFSRAQRFARLGLVSISIEYRLSEGTSTPIEALSDACHAFQWVRQNRRRLRVEAEKIAGYGVSAGGQLVAAAATLGCGNTQADSPMEGRTCSSCGHRRSICRATIGFANCCKGARSRLITLRSIMSPRTSPQPASCRAKRTP